MMSRRNSVRNFHRASTPHQLEIDVGLDIDGTNSNDKQRGGDANSCINNYSARIIGQEEIGDGSKHLRYGLSPVRLFAAARFIRSFFSDIISPKNTNRRNCTIKIFFMSILILNIVQLYDNLIISEQGTNLNGASYYRRVVSTADIVSTSAREGYEMPASDNDGKQVDDHMNNMSMDADADLSIVILASENHQELRELLPSVARQTQQAYDPLWSPPHQEYKFEIIVVDNSCLPETRKVYFDTFIRNDKKVKTTVPHQYIPLCDKNQQQNVASGSNRGIDLVSDKSKYILFLSDDILRLRDKDFVVNMIHILETKSNAGGVVCEMLDKQGRKVVEAGNILWSDASTSGIAGSKGLNIDEPELGFARPIDYGSGSCLMMKKGIIKGHRGFDHLHLSNYIEDADLQSYVQHGLGKEIWFQPRAVALRVGRPKSKGATRTEKRDAVQHIQNKWKDYLQKKHLATPYEIKDAHEKKLYYMRASDLRARDASKANILWLEQMAPNPDNGSGFGRAFDSLSIVSDLGHRITLVFQQELSNSWCDETCQDRISDMGVQMISARDWNDYATEYIDFFDIVYVSRPSTFEMTYGQLRKLYEKHSFTLIYDCEGLWYKRDQLLLSLMEQENISNYNHKLFPGGEKHLVTDMESAKLEIKHAEQVEHKLIQMADTVLAASERETNTILDILPDTQIFTVGHAMSIDHETIATTQFNQRSGILFLASFDDVMYYNGDAVWHFINDIYPLVLAESSRLPYTTTLTVAGRGIPNDLKEFVAKDSLLQRNIKFHNIVDAADILDLYRNARIFIAPHLYGAGIQYEVSKAFSFGIPVVMSSFVANSFGIRAEDQIGCVGSDVQGMKKCVLDASSNEKIWNRLRQNELEFIQRTHSRDDLMKVWRHAIEINLKKIKAVRASHNVQEKVDHGLVTIKMSEPVEPCPEGEKLYGMKYPDVKDAVERGVFTSHFVHYVNHGKNEGKKYLCEEYRNSYIVEPTEPCPEGEEMYGKEHPKAKDAVTSGVFESLFAHYQKYGKGEGKKYYCLANNSTATM